MHRRCWRQEQLGAAAVVFHPVDVLNHLIILLCFISHNFLSVDQRTLALWGLGEHTHGLSSDHNDRTSEYTVVTV